MIINLPTLLTFFRLFAIPILIIFFYLPTSWSHLAATIIFAIAAITDWLDGYLARNLKQTTRFGEFLDPVADKLLVAVVLVLIVGEKGMPYLAIPAAIIVGREIVISALREWMAEIGKRTSVAVSMIGKVKTTLQLIALVVLLYYKPQEVGYGWLQLLGYLLLYLAAGLTLWTMIMYLRAAWPDLAALPDKK